MKLTLRKTAIPDVIVLEHGVFEDERGFFMEVYKQDQFRDAGLPDTFVQLNHSRSAKGVLRGLHFQWEPPMGKLMRVTEGEAYLVAVDIRKDSPTLGRWVGESVTASSRTQIWAPSRVCAWILRSLGPCANRVSLYRRLQWLGRIGDPVERSGNRGSLAGRESDIVRER
jgi:dTDP-4-dehydrorhamnose 3,5-epimerase